MYGLSNVKFSVIRLWLLEGRMWLKEARIAALQGTFYETLS